MSTPTTKTICEFYFGLEPINEEKCIWKCRCKTTRKCDVKKYGYGNLLSHVTAGHPQHIQEIKEFHQVNCSQQQEGTSKHPESATTSNQNTQSSISTFFDKKTKNVYGWIDWVVGAVKPLIFCEKPLTRKYVKLESLSSKTLKKYLFKLAETVETKIASKMTEIQRFSIIFDGWSSNGHHFIGLFVQAPDPKHHDADPVSVLLSCSPLLDETSFTAQGHFDYINSILHNYNLSDDNMVALIGDNCSTNKALANLFGKPLVGCRSHRLNLGVEAFIKFKLAEEVDVIGELMSKLSTLKNSGRLRRYTNLRPKRRCVTRWTGHINMFSRYIELKDPIIKMGDDVEDLLPTSRQEKKIKESIKPLTKLKKATEALQAKNFTMHESDLLFDHITQKFPEFDFSKYIGPQASIVHAPEFERAIIKIQAGKEEDLEIEEKDAVKQLLKAGQSTGERHLH